MQIQLESTDKNTIRSYTDEQIIIADVEYTQSVLVSANEIIYPWNVNSVQNINETLIKHVLTLEPEIILIGHRQLNQQLPFSILEYLSKHRIGIECMSIGAACRTFNVLLAEHRRVVVGLILNLASRL